MAPGGGSGRTSEISLRISSQTWGSRSDQYSDLMSTRMIDRPAREMVELVELRHLLRRFQSVSDFELDFFDIAPG